MAGKRVYFLSDAHLGASYIADARAHEARLVAFLRRTAEDARAVYLLGDILDYWFEYRAVVPRGYIRFFGQLAAMADAGIEIVWFTGNHDIWLFDYLRDQIGIRIVDDHYGSGGILERIDGDLFFLGHGDAFGEQPRGYRTLRRIFRSRLCQRLYASLNPRWTIPFAHGWSSHSRKAGTMEAPVPVFSPRARAAVETRARQLIADHPDLKYIVIGHHHVSLDEKIGPDCRLIILGNWIDRATYAVYDGHTLQLNEFTE